jgi:hypothetical protein
VRYFNLQEAGVFKMATPREITLALRLFFGALIAALAIPAVVQADRAPSAGRVSCTSARTVAQWKASCPKVGRPGITIIGRSGAKVLRGTGGNDTIFGGRGDHTIYAAGGNDHVVAGTGTNHIFSGPGNDLVEATNGQRDVIDCGAGHDIAVVDKIDTVKHCEVVLKPSAKSGSLKHPIPVGLSGDLGNGWRVKVVVAIPNANQRVLAADPSNRPPPSGEQYYMVQLAAALKGNKSKHLNAGFRFRAVGKSKSAYSTFEDSCGLLPPTDLETEDRLIQPGGKVGGNICWSVAKTDVPSLIMFNLGGPGGGKRLYFALR